MVSVKNKPIMLSVIILSFDMLNVVILVMLNVVMSNVTMLNVVAPSSGLKYNHFLTLFIMKPKTPFTIRLIESRTPVSQNLLDT
jgi:hypothetical protein